MEAVIMWNQEPQTSVASTKKQNKRVTKNLWHWTHLYMADTSIPMKIKLTAIHSLISFQLSFSPLTMTTELIKFCRKLPEEIKFRYDSKHDQEQFRNRYELKSKNCQS